MIRISPRFLQLMSQNDKSSVFCVRIDNYRTTSFYRDIVLSDGQAFIADGKLMQVSPPRIDSIIDRQEMSVLLNNNTIDNVSLNINTLIGKRLVVYQVAIDPLTNQPENNINDVLTITRNFVSGAAVQYDTALQGEANFEIKGSSPLLDLGLKRKYYASKEYIQQRIPADTSYDQIYEGSRLVNLKWGKV